MVNPSIFTWGTIGTHGSSTFLNLSHGSSPLSPLSPLPPPPSSSLAAVPAATCAAAPPRLGPDTLHPLQGSWPQRPGCGNKIDRKPSEAPILCHIMSIFDGEKPMVLWYGGIGLDVYLVTCFCNILERIMLMMDRYTESLGSWGICWYVDDPDCKFMGCIGDYKCWRLRFAHGNWETAGTGVDCPIELGTGIKRPGKDWKGGMQNILKLVAQ